MYSRSYGSIEAEGKKEGISIPADYHGNLYRQGKKTQTPPEKEEASAEPSTAPAAVGTTGIFSNLLEKFTAEDIILFVLVFSLLKEDGDTSATILAVILALLLL